jgi:hypothetical protein
MVDHVNGGPTRRRKAILILAAFLLLSAGVYLRFRSATSRLIRQAESIRVGQATKEVAAALGEPDLMLQGDKLVASWGWRQGHEQSFYFKLQQYLGIGFHLRSSAWPVQIQFDAQDCVESVTVYGRETIPH